MTQSRRSSFLEAVFNTLIGYVLALCVQLVVYPAFGAKFSFADNIVIGLIFMVVSLIRSYVIRRFFNAALHQAALKLSREWE